MQCSILEPIETSVYVVALIKSHNTNGKILIPYYTSLSPTQGSIQKIMAKNMGLPNWRFHLNVDSTKIISPRKETRLKIYWPKPLQLFYWQYFEVHIFDHFNIEGRYTVTTKRHLKSLKNTTTLELELGWESLKRTPLHFDNWNA